MPRMFRFKNLAVSVLPSDTAAAITEKLRLCIFHSTICLGWTHCHFPSHCQWPTFVTCWKWVSGCFPRSCYHGTCLLGTCQHYTPQCPFHSIDCHAGTIDCPGGSGCPGGSIYEFDPRQIDPAVYVQQIAELKADLRAALTQVEEHEKTLGDVVKPGSLSEAEALEAELKSALKELDTLKGQLRRKK